MATPLLTPFSLKNTSPARSSNHLVDYGGSGGGGNKPTKMEQNQGRPGQALVCGPLESLQLAAGRACISAQSDLLPYTLTPGVTVLWEIPWPARKKNSQESLAPHII